MQAESTEREFFSITNWNRHDLIVEWEHLIKYISNRNSITVSHNLLKPDQIKLRSVDHTQCVS